MCTLECTLQISENAPSQHFLSNMQHLPPTPAGAHVVVEVVFASKVLEAGGAFEWPLASMRTHMVLEHMLAGKFPRAQVAVERFRHG